MASKKKPRIILAKFGLDGHDNGIKTVTKWLRDAGFEVVYMGLYNTAEGSSRRPRRKTSALWAPASWKGAYVLRTPAAGPGQEEAPEGQVCHRRRNSPDDVKQLKALGAHAIFTPGTPGKP